VDRLVQNGRIAPEAPLPQPPAQHDGSIGGALIVCGGEVTAQRGLTPSVEKNPGAIRSMNDLWELAPIAGQIELRSPSSADPRKLALLPPLVIHSTGNDVERNSLVCSKTRTSRSGS